MNAERRILFFGYSEPGHACLDFLLGHGYEVIALVTHEDAPGEDIWYRRPAAVARDHGIPVYAPASVNSPEWIERIGGWRFDLILSVYYRQLISMRILRLAPLGAFNLHGSLLPRYRGCAPVNWAILHGETRLGMTLHRMVAKADAGPIVDQEAVEVGPRASALEAFQRVVPCGRAVLARQIDALLEGRARETPQDEAKATYFGRRRPEDGRIDWTRTSAEIFNLVRAVTAPFPGAFTDVGAARLMVWSAEPRNPPAARGAAPGSVLQVAPLVVATGDGALEVTRGEWRGAPAPRLQPGQPLSTTVPTCH